jgi:hypothetical protein
MAKKFSRSGFPKQRGKIDVRGDISGIIIGRRKVDGLTVRRRNDDVRNGSRVKWCRCDGNVWPWSCWRSSIGWSRVRSYGSIFLVFPLAEPLALVFCISDIADDLNTAVWVENTAITSRIHVITRKLEVGGFSRLM